ncbi:MAG: hypothetical protein OXE99_07320, partial [Cellvibrionales bacterium]|nr:hypothetical protein [Cellvibrionales bacterium]
MAFNDFVRTKGKFKNVKFRFEKNICFYIEKRHVLEVVMSHQIREIMIKGNRVKVLVKDCIPVYYPN